MVVIEITRDQFLDQLGKIEEWMTTMYGNEQTEQRIAAGDFEYILNQGPGWKLVVSENMNDWAVLEFLFMFDDEHDELAFKLACL